MNMRSRIITKLFRYENGNNFGWAITTDDGGTLTITVEDDGNCRDIGRTSEPRNPDIIGATIYEWYFYKSDEDTDLNTELILILETSKGTVRLSVYNFHTTISDTTPAKVSMFNYESPDTVPAKISWEYRI